uniref:Transcriptional regulator n=1 Tax=Syphacia muris TaxID=451379 RepID=A0A0N5AQU1_9BILA
MVARLREGTVRQCWMLEHGGEGKEPSPQVIRLLTHLGEKLTREILYRSAVNTINGESAQVTLENLKRIIVQIIMDFEL